MREKQDKTKQNINYTLANIMLYIAKSVKAFKI